MTKVTFLILALGWAALFTAACGGASSKATGPTFNCVLNEDDNSGRAASSAAVGDSTQNCGPNRTQDSHDTLPAEEPA